MNASNHITFGDDVLLGWNCTVLDGDGHSVSSESGRPDGQNNIEIGKHVWLASGVTILKGCRIGDGCCVAANGCITKEFESTNLLIGGFNKVLRKDICWKR